MGWYPGKEKVTAMLESRRDDASRLKMAKDIFNREVFSGMMGDVLVNGLNREHTRQQLLSIAADIKGMRRRHRVYRMARRVMEAL